MRRRQTNEWAGGLVILGLGLLAIAFWVWLYGPTQWLSALRRGPVNVMTSVFTPVLVTAIVLALLFVEWLGGWWTLRALRRHVRRLRARRGSGTDQKRHGAN